MIGRYETSSERGSINEGIVSLLDQPFWQRGSPVQALS